MARCAQAMSVVVCVVGLGGCAQAVDDGVPYAEHFESAAALHGVPSDILLGIAASETGLVMRLARDRDSEPVDLDAPVGGAALGASPAVVEEGAQHSMPCFGLMGLCDDAQLAAGAALIGRSTDDVKSDAEANIHAAAALLAQYRRDAEKGGWEEALRRYGARGSAIAGDLFVREVARYAPVELIGVLSRAAQEARPDTSLAHWVGTSNYRSANRQRGQVDKIIIHTMEGSYAGAISWMQNPRAQVSSHYAVRSRDGDISQLVEEHDVAWHVRCWNDRSIGIEHEGFVASPGTWYTEAMYRASARLVADIARRWGVPIDRDHIQGHNDASRLSGCNDHTDPGAGWDWNRYMAYVREAAGQGGGGSGGGGNGGSPSTGRLRGAIYDGARAMSAAGNRLSGVTVRLSNGQSVTTGSDGMYLFTVAAGSYTVTASKAGWSTESVARGVSVGQDTWGSIGLRMNAPAAAPGKYVGVVYDGAQSPQAASSRLRGATVRLSNGMTTTTDRAGYFEFRVAPGTYTATASVGGFAAGTSTRTVTSNADIWGSIGLRR